MCFYQCLDISNVAVLCHIGFVLWVTSNLYNNWSLTKSDQKRINLFELWCWHQMRRISWIMKRSNDSVLQEVQPKTRPLCIMIQSQILSSFGHIARRDGDFLEKVIMQGQVEGSRKPGRPRTRWIDQINLQPVQVLFKIFILLPRIIRDGMPLLTIQTISHDGIEPTQLVSVTFCFPPCLICTKGLDQRPISAVRVTHFWSVFISYLLFTILFVLDWW